MNGVSERRGAGGTGVGSRSSLFAELAAASRGAGARFFSGVGALSRGLAGAGFAATTSPSARGADG